MAAACGESDDRAFSSPNQLAPIVAEVDTGLIFTDGDDSVVLSLSDLEAIEVVQVELFEPFVAATSTFQGPTVAAVFASLGWPTDGDVHMWAINDYAYDMSAADLIEGDAMIATRENGVTIPIEAGGPARIVFPNWSAAHQLEDAWVWSLGSFNLLD